MHQDHPPNRTAEPNHSFPIIIQSNVNMQYHRADTLPRPIRIHSSQPPPLPTLARSLALVWIALCTIQYNTYDTIQMPHYNDTKYLLYSNTTFTLHTALNPSLVPEYKIADRTTILHPWYARVPRLFPIRLDSGLMHGQVWDLEWREGWVGLRYVALEVCIRYISCSPKN